MKKSGNRIRKWSFLIVFFLCGALYLTYADQWQVYAEPVGKMQTWLRNRMEKSTVTAGDEVQDAAGMLPETQENILGDGSTGEYVKGNDTAGNAGTENNAAGDSPAGNNTAGNNNAEGSAQKSGQVQDGETTANDQEPQGVVYETVEDDYFADAVFIGDSRTVGMYEYGRLETISTFYASTGLNIYKLFDAPIVEVAGQRQKITVEEALSQRQFAKIYLMIGINEMGTGTVETFLEKYQEVIAHLQELQPDAIIYVQGIMKVTTERSEQGDYINNEGIETRNEGISLLADNQKVFYLDVNPLICDETGGMESSYTFDGVHLKAQYVSIWKEFLKTHAVTVAEGREAVMKNCNG